MRLLTILCAAAAVATCAGQDLFEKEVRPLLIARCYACHSAASNPPMGGLRVDSREALLKGGARGPSIVPGKPAEGFLLAAVRHADDNLKMPPGSKLKDAEIAALAKWVEAGAPWGASAAAPAPKQFWSFVPPSEPAIPPVKNAAWAKSPLDAFILAGLEAKGLTPAPPAAKRALIRRATYDLTGLPPTPTEVQAFLDDNTPEAFARVVDRLLASPRYGERWGRHWLDVARYADSNGLDENLVYKNAFRYRDYVIAAFNKDKPYDQFVHEQLAGDLLPPAADLATRFERWTATGFLSLGAKMLAEDDPVKMQMDIVDEQLDTAGRAFLGLTLGCARCHDHKFDPITTADYYGLAGIFKSSKTMENFKVVAKWHEYVLAPPDDIAKLEAHLARIEAKTKEIGKLTSSENKRLVAEARTKGGAYMLAAGDVLRHEKSGLRPVPRDTSGAVAIAAGSFASGNANRELARAAANVPKDAKGPFFAEYEVTLPAAGLYQVDLLEQEKGRGTPDLYVNGVLMSNGAEAISNRAASPDAGGWTVEGIFPFQNGKNTIRFEHKSRFAFFEKLRVAPNQLPAGAEPPETTAQIARRYGVRPGFLAQWVDHIRRSQGAPHSIFYAWNAWESGKYDLTGWTSPAAELFAGFTPSNRTELAGRYQDLYEKAASGDVAGALKAIHEPLYEKFGPFRAPDGIREYYPAAAETAIAKLESERKALEESTPDYPRAMGVREGDKAEDIPIHIRGSHWSLGKVTPRHFPASLAGGVQPTLGENQSGRLQFAQWLTRRDNPLTARVMANRIWRWHFGRGIVGSTDNFGRLGEAPSNQPLLDWLSLRFIDAGWSIKAIHRTIMLSNTYRMGTNYNAPAAEIDPENRLLWRANRRRLEVEPMRDGIMAVSGSIDFHMGGSLLNYKDRQYVANTAKGGDVDYDRNLRAVYIPVVRSSMYDVFRAFDLADPSTGNGDRGSTVVAPQALFMMNGSVMLRHSRVMAENLLARPGDDAARIREAYERAYARPPSPAEIDRGLTFLARIDEALKNRETNQTLRRTLAWQSLCKALLSASEFIYLN
ncbi:MAG: PSD1 and planctomycete cytochrome C domain-containing protein [Bryobacteraceae bacterium]